MGNCLKKSKSSEELPDPDKVSTHINNVSGAPVQWDKSSEEEKFLDKEGFLENKVLSQVKRESPEKEEVFLQMGEIYQMKRKSQEKEKGFSQKEERSPEDKKESSDDEEGFQVKKESLEKEEHFSEKEDEPEQKERSVGESSDYLQNLRV